MEKSAALTLVIGHASEVLLRASPLIFNLLSTVFTPDSLFDLAFHLVHVAFRVAFCAGFYVVSPGEFRFLQLLSVTAAGIRHS